MTSAWTAEHIASISGQPLPQAPVITAAEAAPLLPSLDLWDMWPVASADGRPAAIAGGELWMALSAPRRADPGERHFDARIRLLFRIDGGWRDLGNALPDDFGPGNREWAGSALYDPGAGAVTLFYTAAGIAGAGRRGYQQRLFQTRARLDVADGAPRLGGWTAPVESVASDDDVYVRAAAADGEPGKIKAFRDPAHFRDPADGARYLLFAASLKRSSSAFNGAIGLAVATDGGLAGWRLLPPLLHADAVNNELERPHAIVHHGRYYLFWSTQRSVFSDDGPQGPTGLYGMVAASFSGPYRPLNGSGLVFANPASEPAQAYSWWVTADLKVYGFVDLWGLRGRTTADDPALLRRQFGGTPAPVLRLALDGDSAVLCDSVAASR
jgi:levansucrase